MDSHVSNANISRLRVGTITHVRISGVIDETFPLNATSADLNGLLVLDLGRVERISSFGVRRWSEFAAKLPAGALGMYVVHAPPVVVDQLNMVEGFAGVTRVLSVLAPYTCRTCAEDRLRVVNLVDDAAVLAEGKAPAHACPVCANPLEFADQPSEFFDYGTRQQFGTVDPVVMRYLRASMPAEQPELASHLKIIQDDITYITLASALKGDLNVRRLASGLEGRVAFDFSHVKVVEPEALGKLEQVLETAAQGAQVVMCRVPPPALAALARSSKQLPARMATLWLPCECRHCGQLSHQRIQAHEYLSRLRAQQSFESACPICGGSARVPSMPQLQGFLGRTPLTDRPLEDIEGLEPRALSQYLFGTANSEGSGSKQGASTDISNSLSGTKLQILRRLGQGGMAEVFLAKQVGVKGFEKYVVMKKILAQFAENPEFVDMLFAEARANARLTHPNVVQTFDVGVSDGVAYILMEYVRGPDLKKLINELRRKGLALPLEHALRIVAEVAAGLHYAHSYVDPGGTPHPVVHRDVSPHNVLISLDGAIKLSDFGIAKVAGEENTQAGVLKGKISYISPEAASGRPLDARNDVFALGVVLFELLTGQLPFRRDHDAATLTAIVRDPAPVPSQLKPAIPQDVSDLILRALVKDPARRTPSAAAMREEIEAVMAHHRLNSSPAAVAQYFKDTLGDRLAEFTPAAASGTGSHPRPMPVGTGSGSIPSASTGSGEMAAPGGQRGSGSGPRPAVTGSGSGPRPATVGTGTPPRPPTTPSGSSRVAAPPAPPLPEFDELEPQDRTEVVPLDAALTPAAHPVPPRAPVAAPPRPSNPGHAPVRPSVAAPAVAPSAPRPSMPATPAVAPGAPRPSSPGAQVVAPSTPRPSSPAAPAVAPNVPRPSVPAAPAVAPGAARPSASVEPVAAKRSPFLWVALAAGGLLVVGGAAVLFSGGPSSRFVGVGSDEHVYVGGMRADDGAVPGGEAGSTLFVSTAMEGKLRRFGTTQSRDHVDVRTLADAPASLPAATGHLTIQAGPSGCQVKVGDAVLPTPTPVTKAPIEAGRELKVLVSCAGQPARELWVMAVPGQEITVPARTQD
ncbi:serine/threonine protein kinase [Corallococcus sp. M34]|uniref:serine/threonine-protein kinase n=1 Tax=Citreicoccus inhibens TaxID=2849499 RepID=UPI001C2483B1|nr:serine/threonine-protein kinase [Citreicoccus inhibens]MBU8896501.1 serine/threonine protein kinase [Citreicoccus inhibens]